MATVSALVQDIILADEILFRASCAPEGKSEDFPGYVCSQFRYRSWRLLTLEEIAENADRIAVLRSEMKAYPVRHPMDCECAGWADAVARRIDWAGRSGVVRGGECPWWHAAHGLGYENWAEDIA